MRLLSFLAAIAFASTATAGGTSVKGSKHDLSVTGPGPIKAVSETQSCVFCHVSHGGSPESLGARPEIGNDHRPYESTTARGRAAAPTGATRVCLSCHDGTIAVGQTRTRTIQMSGATASGRIPANRRSNLGTDLRSTHPVSMEVASSPDVHAPTNGRVKLDRNGQVQCTSCHDPHSEFGGSPEGRFLVLPTRSAELCASCHGAGRTGSHAVSASPFTAAQGNDGGYATVGEAGCRACHRSHGADATGRLLSRRETEGDDALCVRCHGGAGAGASLGAPADIGRQLSKPSSHSSLGARVHDASEGPDSIGRRLPELSPSSPRHAACVDCHEPHQATRAPAQAPFASGALRGVWGIDSSGRRVEPARFEHEVCFKCHGDSANKPAQQGLDLPRRRIVEQNLRRVFDPGAASYHPVVAPVLGGDVPSLVGGIQPGRLIYCTDCHASDDGPGAGGNSARGPHGSIYAPLLERNYTEGPLAAESPLAYALCYKCHDRDTLLSDRSAFRLHKFHVMDHQTPCSTCHAAHGVAATAGTPARNAHLIDFDVRVVDPGPGGKLEYDLLGRRSGSCTLTCHGGTATSTSTRVHDGRTY